MFGTYLRRELTNRRKQTVIIAIGMALAIALVIIVNAVSLGVKDAQASVLQSVYGVGTDVTVTQKPAATTTAGAPGGEGPRFNFGSGAGEASGGNRELSQSRLSLARGTQTMDASALATVSGVKNVAAAAGVLSLESTSFSGTLPDPSQRGQGGSGSTTNGGGSDGAGGSSFSVSSFSVLGLDPTGDAVGPLSATTLTSGETLSTADIGKDVAVLDSSYAKTSNLDVGGTIAIGGTSFDIVGLVSSTGSDAQTAANVYIPLDVAQSLSTETGMISSVYVQAASASDIEQIKTDLQKALPEAAISTQADLAASVSGSLGTAGELLGNLGTWLSLLVLAAAFLIAILFTISGVTRRTREFGTLKAIGWTNRRIVGQVAGESVVQGLIGGVIGVAVGLLGVLVVNLVAPSLSGGVGRGGGVMDAVGRTVGGTTTGGPGGGFGSGGGFGGGGFGGAQQAAASTDVLLHAPITLWIILVAVGLSVLGGLLAGAIGGWRASRLRPAEALRSVA